MYWSKVNPQPEPVRWNDPKVIAHCLQQAELKEVYAFDLAITFNQETGLHADWHEFSTCLDQLHARGQLKVAGFTRGGMTLYRTGDK